MPKSQYYGTCPWKNERALIKSTSEDKVKANICFPDQLAVEQLIARKEKMVMDDEKEKF